MNLAELPGTELAHRLRSTGIHIEVGPFGYRVRSPMEQVAEGLRLLYAEYPASINAPFSDFHVAVTPPRGPRRWIRPQVVFHFDGQRPLEPFPREQAYAVLEWGMNWCVSTYANQFLKIHAAVVERDGRAVVMPGAPGAGKSTLCAALVARGWRLLSDELALISPVDGLLTPAPRPISLKNESVDVIRAFAPELVIGSVCEDTHKGAVAHVKAPADHIARARERARPTWVIFPRYEARAAARLTPVPRGQAFLRVAENAFNYSLLARRGFETLAGLMDACECYDFGYSSLEEAVTAFESLDGVPECRASSHC